MRRLDGTVSLFHRLPHGGHVDLHLSGNGRVCLLVNSGADVAEVLHELDTVRDELARFQVSIVRHTRPTMSVVRGSEAA